MMKKILVLFLLLSALAIKSQAQANAKDVVKWKVSVQAVSENTYQLIAEAKMQDGFHIWALDAGGDGSLINTELLIHHPQKIEWKDNWTSNVAPKTEKYDYIDGAVHYYERGVRFTRTFTTTQKQVLQGSIRYQTCNEAMCFPPQDYAFEISVP